MSNLRKMPPLTKEIIAHIAWCRHTCIFYSGNEKPVCKKDKGSPYSITERRAPELIPVLGS